MTDTGLATVAVLGLGQVGTSIALALRDRGVRVLLADSDGQAVDSAVDRGAGERLDEDAPRADLLVIAVPPEALPGTLRNAQERNLASVYTDVAGVKAAPATRARQLGCDMTGFVPGHPIGEETFTDDAARPDLFRGAAWALCEDEGTRPDAVTLARRLVELCGAMPVLMDADTHDRLVALISHAPYLVATAMAGALVDAPVEALGLRPAGVGCVTGPAAVDPELWRQVLNQNARWVSCVLSEIAADLVDACAALQLASTGDDSYFGEVAELLRRGHAGRRRLVEAGHKSTG
jgi:prephenate dehydrogenase